MSQRKAKPSGGKAQPRLRRSRQIKIAGRDFYLKSESVATGCRAEVISNFLKIA
jgi:hypothetical protein